MASTGLQLVGFVFGVFSWVGMIATCASPEWRRNNPGEVILHYHISYEGLWTNCKLELTGVTTCDTNASFYIGVPAVVQVCRALMISAIVLGFCAILITIFGIKCTSIGNSNPRAKARAAIVGGILFLIAGLHVGMAASIYAWCTSSKCLDQLQVTGIQNDYKIGPGIIGGWIVMTSSIWSALLMIMNYKAYVKPAKIVDLSHIRAGELTGQFSDIASEGAKGVYKPKSPVDSGYTSTGLDSNGEVYSTVSYPSSVSSTYSLRSKLLQNLKSSVERKKKPVTNYQTAAHPSPITSRLRFGIFRNSYGKVTRVSPIATTHI